MSIPLLVLVAVLSFVGVLFIPGPYKYRIGDCVGIDGHVVFQVIDRKDGQYWLDREPEFKETRLKPIVFQKESLEDDTLELVKCPERIWR